VNNHNFRNGKCDHCGTTIAAVEVYGYPCTSNGISRKKSKREIPASEGNNTHGENGTKHQREEPSSRNPYDILGVPIGSSEDVVREAYKMKAKMCHPDLVDNMDPEIKKVASRRFIEIKGAYDAIMGQ
jgi:hypothetical protein